MAATAKVSKKKLQADKGESNLTRFSPKAMQTHCKSHGLSVAMMWPHYGVTGLPRPYSPLLTGNKAVHLTAAAVHLM